MNVLSMTVEVSKANKEQCQPHLAMAVDDDVLKQELLREMLIDL